MARRYNTYKVDLKAAAMSGKAPYLIKAKSKLDAAKLFNKEIMAGMPKLHNDVIAVWTWGEWENRLEPTEFDAGEL